MIKIKGYPMSRVLVPLAKGFEEIEAVSIIDILRRGGLEVLVARLSEDFLVEGANGICIKTDCHMQEIQSGEIDMIVLPGGWDGTYALADDTNVQRILQEMDAEGKNIGAICAAPFALNKAGVLKEQYTCYPSVEKEINRDGYMGDSSMVVTSKNVMTSRGPATAICFALEILKKLVGESTYESVKSGVLANYCESK